MHIIVVFRNTFDMKCYKLLIQLLCFAAAFFAGWESLCFIPETEENVLSLYEPSVPSSAIQSDFGKITIESEEGVSLAYAKLMINGLEAASFAAGCAEIRLRPGDIISIDACAYRRKLVFTIKEKSSSLSDVYLNKEIICNGSTELVGTAVFQ